LPTASTHAVGKANCCAGFANSFGPCCWQSKLLAKLGFFANSLVQRLCQQHGPKLLAKQAVGKAVVPFANRTLPTAVASLLAKVTAAELTAPPFANSTRGSWRSFPNRARVPVGGELFPVT
jgi:hypothetical protein